jgi:hypothetical protein
MQAGVEVYWQEMVNILDLLLRWAVLRFAEDKQQTSTKVQSFLSALFTKMKVCCVGASDNEGNVFLPCVCDKCGYKNDRVRDGYNRLLTLFGSIFNPQRFVMFLSEARPCCDVLLPGLLIRCLLRPIVLPWRCQWQYLLYKLCLALMHHQGAEDRCTRSAGVQGMDSKNTKSRADCADHVSAVVRELGADVVRRTPRPASKGSIFKQLAALAAERDAPLRKAALGALMALYEQRGTRLWAALGENLPATQRDLVTERVKYVDKELAKKGLRAGDVVRRLLSKLCALVA